MAACLIYGRCLMRNLVEDRKILDEIDDKIAKLLDERMHIVRDVGEYKLNNDLNVEDRGRELDVIKRLEQLMSPEFRGVVAPIYEEIFKSSKDIISKVKNREI